MKKALKITGKILLALLALIAIACIALCIVHKILLAKEEKMLAEKGYLNRVSVGDCRLNVCYYGSSEPEHTLVGLSGLGVNNYSVVMRRVTDRFADKNRIVFVDRAGYGLSDDSDAPQTIGQIVEDYRAALKNAGFEAPYLLLPHSIAGVYSTYWVSRYPDEIEGIVFLDGTEITSEDPPFDLTSGALERFEAELCKIGFQRPFMRFFDANAFYEAPEGLEDVNRALNFNKGFTRAMASETKLINENCAEMYRNLVSTDVPKVYIDNYQQTREDFDEMIDMMNALQKKSGGKMFSPPDDVDGMLAMMKENYENVVLVYAESLGNCEVKPLNGTHMLYYHRPDETADIIEGFIEGLDRN